jgi:hypothetical protein
VTVWYNANTEFLPVGGIHLDVLHFTDGPTIPVVYGGGNGQYTDIADDDGQTNCLV